MPEAGKLTLNFESGPMRWMHHHIQVPSCGDHGCELIESQEFEVKYRNLFGTLRRRAIESRFQRLLKYKHELIDHDLDLLNSYPFTSPMKILIAGSNGMIGRALTLFLEFAGHEVHFLVRNPGKHSKKAIHWNPDTGEVDRGALEGFDAVVNLAGRNIAGKRWSDREKRALRNSRIATTERLAHVLGGLENPPKTFICASAVGFYGDHGNEVITEETQRVGESFVSQLASEWEAASTWVQGRGVRLANMRFGLVLSPVGGALGKMLPAFRVGLGSIMGDGSQYTSWIALDDVVGALYHTLMTSSLSGPINVSSPHPVTGREFGQKLAQHFNKGMGPALTPSFIDLLFGQMGHELFLLSHRVVPEKLEASGFRFRYPRFENALDHLLGEK